VAITALRLPTAGQPPVPDMSRAVRLSENGLEKIDGNAINPGDLGSRQMRIASVPPPFARIDGPSVVGSERACFVQNKMARLAVRADPVWRTQHSSFPARRPVGIRFISTTAPAVALYAETRNPSKYVPEETLCAVD
jgi:hypothetical protein